MPCADRLQRGGLSLHIGICRPNRRTKTQRTIHLLAIIPPAPRFVKQEGPPSLFLPRGWRFAVDWCATAICSVHDENASWGVGSALMMGFLYRPLDTTCILYSRSIGRPFGTASTCDGATQVTLAMKAASRACHLSRSWATVCHNSPVVSFAVACIASSHRHCPKRRCPRHNLLAESASRAWRKRTGLLHTRRACWALVEAPRIQRPQNDIEDGAQSMRRPLKTG